MHSNQLSNSKFQLPFHPKNNPEGNVVETINLQYRQMFRALNLPSHRLFSEIVTSPRTIRGCGKTGDEKHLLSMKIKREIMREKLKNEMPDVENKKRDLFEKILPVPERIKK
ncbi:hypothetical protein NPIL_689201 [Nephila pilipes]|uniref:Uncharacterized protein n=1 Tax=Nephila pilipes TaxID=299642 RepID=A0A8X6MQD6_NEPPI|nr:hypothetical protein NPIL_689201 [Nephila pilipes]